MWFRPHPWSMCRLELLVRLVPLPPIRTFLCAKLRFLRKVRKSMSFKMILNSHNSLFAHIFFNSHFIRYQRLKEQGASSYGLSTDAFSALLKKSAEILFQYPLSLKINTLFRHKRHFRHAEYLRMEYWFSGRKDVGMDFCGLLRRAEKASVESP